MKVQNHTQKCKYFVVVVVGPSIRFGEKERDQNFLVGAEIGAHLHKLATEMGRN